MAMIDKPAPKGAPAAGPSPADDQYYAETNKIHPRRVKGVFRKYKWWAVAVLMMVWHLGPFLRWDRGPGAPDQAVMVDMAGRRAYFFFIEIWPQEVYYLTGLLLIAAIGLFLMSALFGRIWCGFFCWQTVYTDLFVLVERLVIGDRNVRIAFDRKPMSAEKLVKRATVIAAWVVIAAGCGIAFTLYFGNAPQMLLDIFAGREDTAVYGAIAVVGGSCLLLAGWGREQVCIYACPYSRFQAAMFDEHSLIVSYEAWRGEPRAPVPLKRDFTGRGHCIDCKMCVQSCPTGIDIRDGSQLACVGCALCIDACNAMMDKFGLPRGLISYDSISNLEARAKGQPAKYRVVRPRSIIYTALIAVVVAVMAWSLVFRKTTDVNILHERAPLFVQLSDGSIRNGYVYKVLNMVRQDRTYTLEVAGIEGATLSVVGGDQHVAKTEVRVAPDDVGTFNVFVTAPEARLQGKRTPVFFLLTDETGKTVRSESLFAGPEK
jgi:cytochrome c oxidase accessory protein FixG